MRSFVRILFLCSALFSSLSRIAYSQETNYWSNNYGATSILRGGVEVGSAFSNSAIYYNPGGLSFLDGSYLEAQADFFSLDMINIENGAGDGVPISLLQLDASPSMFSYA